MNNKSLILAILVNLTTVASGIEVGQQVQNTISINGRNGTEVYANFPLIEGQWSVEYTDIRGNNSNSNFRNINLMQFEGGKLKLASEYSIKVDGSTTRWTDEPCKVEPTLHKNNYGTSLWKQRCLVIEPITFLQNNNDVTRAALSSLASRGIKNDFNSLRLTYTRYGDSDKFMRIRFHLFPSTFGLENPTVGSMNTSPWSPVNVASDPAKVQFISALTNYAERLVKSLDLAYETGGSVAPIPAFMYPESLTGNRVEVNEIVSELPSKEERLKYLKKIFEKGLITKDIYEAQQKNILSNF
ncbi:hypothetical protein [Rhodoferax sp.]|uniref:hypothetical protein n=1 Tax=Rhodoferax sp. TaxID=50421 RepID=UPI00262340A4|nr:hypothetical protein [Rhodoferax sp.]MDD4942728.1 hypothetical protein [Rhodoferax sp.]MDD5479981.1 hypothetical protein [Rhodoferax sp.]